MQGTCTGAVLPHSSQKSYVRQICEYMLRVTRDYLYLVLIQALTELPFLTIDSYISSAGNDIVGESSHAEDT